MTLGYAWFKYFKLLIYSLSCWLSEECCFEIEKAKKLVDKWYKNRNIAVILFSFLYIISLVCKFISLPKWSSLAEFTIHRHSFSPGGTGLDTFLFGERMNFLQKWCWKPEFESSWILRLKHQNMCFHWNLTFKTRFIKLYFWMLYFVTISLLFLKKKKTVENNQIKIIYWQLLTEKKLEV